MERLYPNINQEFEYIESLEEHVGSQVQSIVDINNLNNRTADVEASFGATENYGGNAKMQNAQ